MFRNKEKTFNKKFKIVDEKTRYKLYKSGKNWVKASTTNLALLRVGKMAELIPASITDTEELEHKYRLIGGGA